MTDGLGAAPTRRDVLTAAATGAAGLTALGALAPTIAAARRRPTPRRHAAPPAPAHAVSAELRRLARHAHMVGVSVLAVDPERVLFGEAWGWAIRGKRRMALDSNINVASVSKTITATAVLQLVERGRLALDADVNRYLRHSRVYGPRSVRSPSFPHVPITVRQLLTHLTPITDGYSPGPYDFSYQTREAAPRELGEWLHDFLTPGGRGYAYDPQQNFLEFAPGTTYNYSDVAYDLAGHLVEAVTGIYFPAYCRAHILRPLGMDRSDFERARTDKATWAHGYAYVQDGIKQGRYADDRWLIRGGRIGEHFTGWAEYVPYSYPLFPDGGLRSSALELARWARTWLNHGALDGHRVLPASLAKAALSRQVPAKVLAAAPPDEVSGWRTTGQGFGWERINGDPDWIWQKTGTDLGVSTIVKLDVRRRIGAVIVSNVELAADNDPRAQMADAILAAAAR